MLRLKLIFTLLAISLVIWGQNNNAQNSPKIGLVLSGGGAKGLAHIGVLHVLEEAGIKPDYITGTSMGSIIGALYAMGYTADEISLINKNSNWNKLLSDNLSLNKIVMEEKYESNRYLFQFPIRNYKFKLPTGIIEGQLLESRFADLTWPLTYNENFDSLPIPFRCMSVDLITGQTIEHKSGDLAEAIRASMSIPSIFAPEKIDSLLLVDGGITKNFPVQEVLNMGADIVIGVYVGFDEIVTSEDLFSFSDILTRSISLAGIIDSKLQSKKVDILITPDLKDLGSSDFSKGTEIEKYGKEAALKLLPQLKRLADSLNLQNYAIPKISKPNTIKISNIEVQGLRHLSPGFVIGNSGIKIGSEVSQKEIAEAIDLLYGTQYFSKVTYSLKKHNENFTLILKAKEKTRAFLNLAAYYENDIGAGLVTNLTLRNWGIPSSHFLLSINIAENPGFRTNLTKYWGKKQRLMNFYFANANKNDLPYYKFGSERGAYIFNSFEAGTGLKLSVGLNQQMASTVQFQNNEIIPNDNMKLLVHEALFDEYSLKGYAVTGSYKIQTTNDLYFPKNGLLFEAEFKHSFSSKVDINRQDTIELIQDFVNLNQQNFRSIYSHIDFYQSIGKKFSFNFGGTIGLNSANVGISGYYIIGGMLSDYRKNYIPLAGFNYGEIIANNVATIHANAKFEIYPRFYIAINSNLAFQANEPEQLFDFVVDSKLNEYFIGYNAGLMYNSPIGPVKLFLGDNISDNEMALYFSVGFPF